MGRYEVYDATNRFYLSLGYKEFEVFPTLWDEWNPCQIYKAWLWIRDLGSRLFNCALIKADGLV